VKPMLGMRLVEVLEAAGIMVDLPSQRSSGYPNIAYGELENALKTASYNVSRLMEAVEKGYEIVSLEPTATYALRFAYPRLLDSTPGSKKVASKTYGVKEYLAKLVEMGRLKVSTSSPKKVGAHIPCHQRALDGAANTVKLLQMAGHTVEVIEKGTCCGMAGSFGMKKGVLGYDLAVEVGGERFQLFKQSDAEMIAT
jgi:L-lactate dehydrogenase complex protein LldF